MKFLIIMQSLKILWVSTSTRSSDTNIVTDTDIIMFANMWDLLFHEEKKKPWSSGDTHVYGVNFSVADLQTVEKNLMERKYLRLCDFVKDVTKVFDNCRLYNPADTPFYQCAEVLETFFVQRLKTLKERI